MLDNTKEKIVNKTFFFISLFFCPIVVIAPLGSLVPLVLGAISCSLLYKRFYKKIFFEGKLTLIIAFFWMIISVIFIRNDFFLLEKVLHFFILILSFLIINKTKINNYDLIISSRYHGLVAAISQGIPVISIGWSHKYDELMSSYLLGKYNFTKKNQDLLSLVNNLGDNKNYYQIQKLINEKNKKSIIQLNKMWKDVIDLINEKNSSYSIR